MDCYHDLMTRLAAAGYYPYRLGLASLTRGEQSSSYSDLLREMKKTLDPAGILAPGRYVSPEETGLQKVKARAVG